METIIQYAGMLVSIGAVYGLIRADLKNLHEKAVAQSKTNELLWNKASEIDKRINDHIEHHHLRVK